MQTVDQFARKLSDSGLMSVEQIQAFCDTLPPDNESQAFEDLSRKLVEKDILTEYQVKALSSNDSPPLVVGDYVVLEKVGAGWNGRCLQSATPTHEAKCSIENAASSLQPR